jgi:hypothetical protein
MGTIRVALLEMRQRLRDILTDAVAREPDLHLVVRDATLAALNDVRPDVLVCGADDPLDPTRPKALLALFPRARILVVAHSGRHAAIFELRPTRLVLREVSMDGVVDAIRSQIGVDDPRWPPLESSSRENVAAATTIGGERFGGDRSRAAGSDGQRARLSWREKP